jgi:hypothetical protein
MSDARHPDPWQPTEPEPGVAIMDPTCCGGRPMGYAGVDAANQEIFACHKCGRITRRAPECDDGGS